MSDEKKLKSGEKEKAEEKTGEGISSGNQDDPEFKKRKVISDMIANMVITDKRDKKPYFAKG